MIVMDIIYPLTLLIIINFHRCLGYLATVELMMESFRTLNPKTISENDWCDHWGGGHCDFVFYVHNCSRLDGINYECTERISRYYGPSDTDTFNFPEGKPATAFLIDRFPRELVVNITVYDEDEGWSQDDFVGNYIIKFDPNIISGQQSGIPSLQQHIITIPDHSEMTVRYRAYCNDQECRSSANPQFARQPLVNRVSRSTVFTSADLSIGPIGTEFDTRHIVADSRFPNPPPFSSGYTSLQNADFSKLNSVDSGIETAYAVGHEKWTLNGAQTSFNRGINTAKTKIDRGVNSYQSEINRGLNSVQSNVLYGGQQMKTDFNQGVNSLQNHLNRNFDHFPSRLNVLPRIGDTGRPYAPSSYPAGSVPISNPNSIIVSNFMPLLRHNNYLGGSFDDNSTPFVTALGASGSTAAKLIRATRLVAGQQGRQGDIYFTQSVKMTPKENMNDMEQVIVNNEGHRRAKILVAKYIPPKKI